MSAQVRSHARADVQLWVHLDKIKGDDFCASRNRIQSVAMSVQILERKNDGIPTNGWFKRKLSSTTFISPD
jgi:hypothetical protein